MTPTSEPNVFVESEEDGPPKRVVFLDILTGERWAEIGTCNQCGLCEIGSVNENKLDWDPTKRRGEPYSCSDPHYKTRLPVVNRPSIKMAMKAMAADIGIENGGCSYEYEILGDVK